MRYTHDVQYVTFRPEQVENKGQVEAAAAIEAFRQFPFKEQLKNAQEMEDPTMPTISFRCLDDGAVLAIWATEPHRYEVYLESKTKKMTIEETEAIKIENLIARFFSGLRSELISSLSGSDTAVVK